MLIYKATNNLSGKSYIGLTEDLDYRKSGHYTEARSGSIAHFHKALRKYDEDTWEWTVIAECDSREEAGILEIAMIEAFDTFKNGYNSTTGGEKGWTVTPEIRKKISEARKGIPASYESRIKRSETMKGKMPWNAGKTDKPKRTLKDLPNVVKIHTVEIEPSTHPLAGKHKSKKHREAISKSRKELYASEKGSELKEKQSEAMKRFYDTDEGKLQLENLRKKCGRPQKKAVDKAVRKLIFKRYTNGELMQDLADEYNVSRASIYRYIKEFT